MSRFAPPALLVVVGIALARWTWGTWPDVLVDFGRELYVPWRMTEGDRLFVDVAWFNGPLSPSWNALWFRALGTGLSTLVWVNLALLALATGMLLRLLTAVSDRLAATAACVLFLTLFAFGQLVGIGNYNWLCPYSHEATHGLVLALGTLSCLYAWGERGGSLRLGAAGFLFGLTFLTKATVFLATASGVGVAFALLLARGGVPRTRSLGLFTLAAAIGPAVAFALLALTMPAQQALRGLLGSWPSVIGGEVAELAFYQRGMGLDRPGEQLGAILRWCAGWLLVLGPPFGIALGLRGRARDGAFGKVLAPLVFVVIATSLYLAREAVGWKRGALPVPLFLVGMGVVLALRAKRSGLRRVVPRDALALGLVALAFVLLARMLLNARLSHYGFTLAVPGVALVVVAIVGWLPRWIDARGGQGRVLRAAALALLAVAAVEHLRIVSGFLEHKSFVVGAGRDRFRADLRGRFVEEALIRLRARSAGPDGVRTLAVVPEGVTINYLARLANPTPYINFMPPELVMFGERAIVDAFEREPPDLALFVHKDTSEYGFRYFGRDYGQALSRWFVERYRPVEVLGQPPLTPGTTFGIAVLERIDR